MRSEKPEGDPERDPESGGSRLPGLPWMMLATGGLLGALYAYRQSGRAGTLDGHDPQRIHLEHSVTVARPAAEVWAFWRDLENFPHFFRKLRSLERTGVGRSRWVLEGPTGSELRWEMELTHERPGELLAWRTLPGATVPHAGRVEFLPAQHGTEVRVQLDYHPPTGRLGKALVVLFGGDAEAQLRDDLQTMKKLLESGETGA